METLVQEQKLGLKGDMKAGDRIRVKESVIIYHHPGHRGQGFDLKDTEGEVVDIVTQWHGRPVSANFPILVQFPQIGKRFRAHLRENELEVI